MAKKAKEGFYIEALQTTHIIASMVDDFLIGQIAISKHPKAEKRVLKISKLLGELYQDIGNINTDKLK